VFIESVASEAAPTQFQQELYRIATARHLEAGDHKAVGQRLAVVEVESAWRQEAAEHSRWPMVRPALANLSDLDGEGERVPPFAAPFGRVAIRAGTLQNLLNVPPDFFLQLQSRHAPGEMQSHSRARVHS